MLLSRAQIEHVGLPELKEFLGLEIPEGPLVDYKRHLSGSSEREQKRESRKDVSAFANAAGGMVVLGVTEPREGLSLEERLVGIDGGEEMATWLERLAASSLEPRIPGLLIRSIPLESGRYVVIAYVPPSLIRPHVVVHRGHRSFYIRHSESSVPMSTHEIRDAVLSAATSEKQARQYCENEERDAKEYFVRETPWFIVQAMPLVPLVQPWTSIRRRS